MNEKQLKPEEKEKMISEFLEIIRGYNINWVEIIKTNQFEGEEDAYKVERYKVDKFCDAITSLRENSRYGPRQRKMSLRKFGEIISYSATQVQNIENHKIQYLPVDKLEGIAEKFSTSVAYLIGLTKIREKIPNKIDGYFWEHPKSKYKIIETEIRDRLKNDEKEYSYMIANEQDRIEDIKEEILHLIGKNYELAFSLRELLSKKGQKRYNIIKVLEYLKNI